MLFKSKNQFCIETKDIPILDFNTIVIYFKKPQKNNIILSSKFIKIN